MRLTFLFLWLTVVSAFGQDLKIKLDSTAISVEEFQYAALIDSLFLNDVLKPNYKSTSEHAQPISNAQVDTETLKDRLETLNSKTPLSITYSPLLEQLINKYLKNRKTSFDVLMQRSLYYFPLFEQVLDKHKIPLEIKYLAIVESALRPKAKSHAGATGLWQFMYSTAKQQGLEVSSYVDERCDPLRSTNAAALYLKSLHSIFDNWELALAAYNAGPGNVTKAIRRSGGYTNYWNIRPFLPRETANYIPVFLATLYIFEYAEEHGFKPANPQISINETDTIRVQKTIHLEYIEDVLDIETEILTFLNPSYKLDIIPFRKERNYTLRLPAALVGKFVSNEKKIYDYAQQQYDLEEKPMPKFYKMNSKLRYQVRPGDYLGKIANKFNVSIRDIKIWNGMKTDFLNAGDRLLIYTKSLDYQPQPKASISVSSNESQRIHVVQRGESLWTIAQFLPGISVQNLQEWNDIKGGRLKVGTRLIISKSN